MLLAGQPYFKISAFFTTLKFALCKSVRDGQKNKIDVSLILKNSFLLLLKKG